MQDEKAKTPGKPLNDAELAATSGGVAGEDKSIGQIVCPKCGYLNIIYPYSSNYCEKCNEQICYG